MQLPPEDPKATDKSICAKLLRNQYGLRDAGQNFELYVNDVMVSLGFTGGLWCCVVFFHEKKDLRAYVFGDNFVITGPPGELAWFERVCKRSLR